MLVVPAARASDLIGLGATGASLEVHGDRALATFREGAAVRHVLVWGAINARTPAQGPPQVRFSHD